MIPQKTLENFLTFIFPQLVELIGIEPTTSGVQSRRSPS